MSSVAPPLKRLPPEFYNEPTGQSAILLEGDEVATAVGDAMISIDTASTKTEIRSAEGPAMDIVATDYTEGAVTGKITFRQTGKLAIALGYMGVVEPYHQAAVVSRSHTFHNVSTFGWMELKADETETAQELINTVVTAVKVGATVFEEGVHYVHDSASGQVQVFKWPDETDEGADVIVTFSAPLIDADPDHDIVGVMSSLVLRGKFILRQRNRRGKPRKLILRQIAIGGDSRTVTLVTDSKDVTGIEVSFTATPDGRFPEATQYGYSVGLKEVA